MRETYRIIIIFAGPYLQIGAGICFEFFVIATEIIDNFRQRWIAISIIVLVGRCTVCRSHDEGVGRSGTGPPSSGHRRSPTIHGGATSVNDAGFRRIRPRSMVGSQ